MGLAKPSELGGSSFFKPAEHVNDIALVVEPLSIAKNVPNTYRGKTSERDEVTANVTVFRDQAALDSKTPSDVLRGVKVTSTALVSKLEAILSAKPNDALPAIIRKESGENTYYAFKDLDDATLAKVAEWYEEREAQLQAAIADAPSFD